jgi:hypothetical protein
MSEQAKSGGGIIGIASYKSPTGDFSSQVARPNRPELCICSAEETLNVHP